MKIDYIDVSEYMIKPPLYAYGQSAYGYGKKITSRYMVKPRGGRRFYRVYATCYSNCASHWVIIKGKKYHLMDTALDVAADVTK